MKLLGYGLSGVGLGLIVASSKNIYSKFGFANFISGKVVLISGILMVLVGVFFLRSVNGRKKKSKVKQSKEEVPIYEGEGKDRKIVGYQKA